MADLDQEFQQAADQVKNLASRPSDQELLELYGLFKQASVGDCDQPKPGMFQLKEKAKHEAWESKKGMGKEEAKKAYISLSKKLQENYGAK